MFNTKIIFILFITIVFTSVSHAISFGYSYYDTTTQFETESVSIGSWAYVTQVIGLQLAKDLLVYADDQIATNQNTAFTSLYQQSGNLSSTSVLFDNINFFGYDWDITGFGTAANVSTLGYVSLIDRIKDTNDLYIHPIKTNYTETPSYNEYNFFVSNDAQNSNTSNRFSLRMNYGASMVTDQPITNINTISFYAAVGQNDTNDIYTIVQNRQLTVSISTDKINWTVLSVLSPSMATGDTYNFDFYTLTIPLEFQNQDLYIGFSYNGEGIKSGNTREYSRLIIDELSIITE